jgi:hypothetical protein
MILRPQKVYEELTSQIENLLERSEVLPPEPQHQQNPPGLIPSSSSGKEKDKGIKNADLRPFLRKIEEDFNRKDKAPRKPYKRF